MPTPITLKEWVKSKPARAYIIISAFFTVCLSIIPVLHLFGLDHIVLPSLLTTNKSWLLLNFLLQSLFTGYVAFGTAVIFSELKHPDIADEREMHYWQNLELQDPSTPQENGSIDANDWVRFKLKVNKVARQFAWFWFLGWLSWFLHYIYLLLASLKLLDENGIFSNLLNNLNSLMFIFLFMTLTVSTAKRGVIFWVKIACIVLGVFVVEWVISNQLKGNILVALLFAMISGLFASMALAAFVGSIDSKFINIPVRVVSILYVYAALQSLYVLFVLRERIESLNISVKPEELNLASQDIQRVLEAIQSMLLKIFNFLEIADIAIIILAALFKAILFITVTWMLRTGRLIYFIIEEGSLNYKRDKNFEEFSQTIETSASSL